MCLLAAPLQVQTAALGRPFPRTVAALAHARPPSTSGQLRFPLLFRESGRARATSLRGCGLVGPGRESWEGPGAGSGSEVLLVALHREPGAPSTGIRLPVALGLLGSGAGVGGRGRTAVPPRLTPRGVPSTPRSAEPSRSAAGGPGSGQARPVWWAPTAQELGPAGQARVGTGLGRPPCAVVGAPRAQDRWPLSGRSRCAPNRGRPETFLAANPQQTTG